MHEPFIFFGVNVCGPTINGINSLRQSLKSSSNSVNRTDKNKHFYHLSLYLCNELIKLPFNFPLNSFFCTILPGFGIKKQSMESK